MPIKESKGAQLYSKPSVYVVSRNMLLQSGETNHQFWWLYAFGWLDLRLQLAQTMVGTQLDSVLTTWSVTCIRIFDKWSIIGTEAKNLSISVGIEMPRLPSDERNSDKHNCSIRKLKPPKLYLHQRRVIAHQQLQSRSSIPFEEYEDVLYTKYEDW